MKRILLLALLAICIPSVSGCDFFRKLADRPTSAEIEAKRQYIEAAETAHRNRLDSLKLAQKQASDSLAVLDSLKNSHSNLVSSGKMGGVASSKLDKRYCIIVGSFADRNNAAKMASMVSAAGYEPVVMSYNNGFTAVGVCPSDTLTEVFAKLKEVKTQKFCPADAWVLVNE